MEKPSGREQSAIVPEVETIFDLEGFNGELASLSSQYSDAFYIAKTRHFDHAQKKHEVERRDRLHDQLLDKCADALKSTSDNKATLHIIDEILLQQKMAGGVRLFTDSLKAEFYHELLLRVTKKGI